MKTKEVMYEDKRKIIQEVERKGECKDRENYGRKEFVTKQKGK